nr:DUF934 domain-containing protein [uncultured Pseudogulbenkiania sp.]
MKKIILATEHDARVVNDKWAIWRESQPGQPPILEWNKPVILPLPLWQRLKEQAVLPDPTTTGVWIASDDEYEEVAYQLLDLPLIAVDFPSFRDGRGYSVAYLLRTRYGYRGELRAIGDVLRDQLFYMRRCGFNSFEVRSDKDIQDAIKGLTAYTIRYQGSVDDPVPLFRKRAEAEPAQPDEHWEP